MLGGSGMQYEVSFGQLGRAPRAAGPVARFRLALLGDFSGRANAGTVETGAALAARKPLKVDVDSLDDVLARMKLSLALDLAEDGAVTVPIASLDDFHPDQIVANLPLFEELLTLRRNLASRTGFEKAAKAVLSWSGEAPLPRPPRRARGAAVATDRRLSDFARLLGRPASSASAAEASVDALLRRIVGPLVEPVRDARQEQLTARVDAALAAAMRRVLHHPDFQTAEALWRGVEFLVRRIETGARMEIVLYDVSAEELAADLAATDTLEETGLYGMLVEQPALDAHQGPLSAVLGLYGFELTPPHADLLGRIAQIAAGANAPFIAAIGPDALATPMHEQNPLIQDAFAALQALPQAAYLGLATPRFLLRMPYGRKTDPIDAFAFEEFTRQSGLSGMLWGHPALIAGLLLAQGFAQQGAKMKLGSILGVGDMPYYVYVAEDGDQVALPCTERLYTERQAAQVARYGVMPLISLRGRPEVRLGGLNGLAGGRLAGFWTPPEAPPEPEPAAAEAEPEETETTESAESDEAAATESAEGESEETSDSASDGSADTAETTETAGGDDLDKLLAGLNAPEAPAEENATEPDLDALLASLK